MAREIHETMEGYELCSQPASEVEKLVRKLERSEVTIAVIGQFKRGKTSMVNRLLGKSILPVGIVPITAAVTRIRGVQADAKAGQSADGSAAEPAGVQADAKAGQSAGGNAAEPACTQADAEDAKAGRHAGGAAGADAGPQGDLARVWFLNGLCEEVPAEDLHRYISEQENHGNELGVAEVELRTDAAFLQDGLVLVDTPGVGSVHENNSRSAYDFARESDGVIFMLSVDSPINQIEIDFLKDTRRFAGKFYFVVNKIDIIDEEELEQYLQYCDALIREIMEIEAGSSEAQAIRLIPIRAKKNVGIERLQETIRQSLMAGSRQIMERSVGLTLLEILQGTRRQIHSYREVLKMAPNVFHRRFDEMHESLQQRIAQCEALPRTDESGAPKQYLRARLNEEKMLLASEVREQFGIEYYYEVDRGEAAELLSRDEYADEYIRTCKDLEQTMETIFMYKEENAYTVARRIEDLNILLHTMERQERRIRRQLQQTGDDPAMR